MTAIPIGNIYGNMFFSWRVDSINGQRKAFEKLTWMCFETHCWYIIFTGKLPGFSDLYIAFVIIFTPGYPSFWGHQEAEHSGGKHVWINCSFSFGDMDTKKHSRCCFKKNIKIKSKLSTNHQSKSWCFTLIAYQQENKCLATMAMSLYVLGLFRRSIWKLLPNTLAMFFFWNYNHYIT